MGTGRSRELVRTGNRRASSDDDLAKRRKDLQVSR